MTRLILIRHGQSESNIARTFAGHLDIPLSRLGHQQAAVTAEYIASHYPVDCVYASDLCRAFDTGKAVADKLGLEVIADKALREICAGDWQGRAFTELAERYPQSFWLWRNDIGNCVCDGGESVAQLQQRILQAVTAIAEANDGKTLVIATHATSIRTLQCYCEGKPLSEMKNVPWAANASLTVIRYENGQFLLELTSFDGHLGAAASKLPKSV